MAVIGTNWLGVTDYLVISVSFAICILIGWYNARKRRLGDNQVDDYLLGSRKMSTVPVAISTAATMLSSLAITGQVGELFRYGLIGLFSYVTFCLGQFLMSFAVIPVFHKKRYTSVFEFLEMRYDKSLRLIASARYILISCLYLGLLLYIPSISFGAVSGISYWVVVLVGGSICILYCTMGGFKAVVWTDVFQTVVMMASLILFLIMGIRHIGGIDVVMAKAFNGTEAGAITLVESTGTTRYSIWSLLTFGLTMAATETVGNQAAAQRILCVQNDTIAKQSYLVGLLFTLLFCFLCIAFSIIILAGYARCDPVQLSSLTGVFTDDHIFIYAVTEFMGQYPGIIGLSLVSLINASLSTFSSFINALAASTLKDFLKPQFPNFFKEEKEMLACKGLTVIYGVIAMLASFAIPYMGGAVKAMCAVRASTDGTIAGAFIIGMFSTRANTRACKCAVLISASFVILLAAVSLIVPENYDSLPLTITECEFDFNETHLAPVLNRTDVSSRFLEALNISFFWFLPIGFVITIVATFLLSFIIGTTLTVDESLLSPWRLKFNKNKTDKQILEDEQVPLKIITDFETKLV